MFFNQISSSLRLPFFFWQCLFSLALGSQRISLVTTWIMADNFSLLPTLRIFQTPFLASYIHNNFHFYSLYFTHQMIFVVRLSRTVIVTYKFSFLLSFVRAHRFLKSQSQTTLVCLPIEKPLLIFINNIHSLSISFDCLFLIPDTFDRFLQLGENSSFMRHTSDGWKTAECKRLKTPLT